MSTGFLTLTQAHSEAESWLRGMDDAPVFERMAVIYRLSDAEDGYATVLARATALETLVTGPGFPGLARIVFSCTASVFRAIYGIPDSNPRADERWWLRVKGSDAPPQRVRIVELRRTGTERNPKTFVDVQMVNEDGTVSGYHGEYPLECFGPEPPKSVYFTRE